MSEPKWYEEPWVVIDFETTGVDKNRCMPVSVAAVRFEAGKRVGAYYTLLDPECEIPAGAYNVHKISRAMTQGKPTLPDVYDDMGQLLLDALPVAYNADYDRSIFLRLYGGQPEDRFPATALPWIDPLVWVRKIDKFVKGKGRHKLDVTCERHGVDLRDAHNALGDATATGDLLWALRKQIDQVPFELLLSRQGFVGKEQDKEFQAWLARQPST